MRLILKLSAFFLLFTSAFIFAADEKDSEEQTVIVVSSGQVHNGNFFAMGSSVEISGVVNGDVYILAEQIVIDGVINGDILVAGGSIDISGKVLNNCRLVGGQILISGSIGNNITAVAGNLQLLPSASIGGGVVATAANADFAATISSDVTVAASNLRISSHIGKDLQGYAGQMRITSRAVIGGEVDYKSSSPAWIEQGAVIVGKVTRHPSFVHELVEGTWIQGLLVGSKVLAILMNFIYTFVIGVVILKFFPRNLEAALHSLQEHPLKSLTYGIMLLILLPLASLVLLMTILGVPFALALIALNVIGFYTAKVYSIFWASNWFFGKVGFRHNRLPGFFCGTVIYFALVSIPIFGFILAFVAMLFGLGAGLVAQTKRGILTPEHPHTKKS